MDFKLRCIKTTNSPIGAKAYKDKVYIFEDGRTTWENGIASCRYDSAEDFFEHNINLGVHFEEVKELKELTFKEVIANIKEGEVWESIDKSKRVVEIRYDKMFNTICLSGTEESEFCRNYMTAVGINQKFKLKRKEYSFEEAFKALEEGKEIESITQYRYKKAGDGYKFYSKDIGEWWKCSSCLSFEELKGKWYINEVN
jgi:hypothetical protein